MNKLFNLLLSLLSIIILLFFEISKNPLLFFFIAKMIICIILEFKKTIDNIYNEYLDERLENYMEDN